MSIFSDHGIVMVPAHGLGVAIAPGASIYANPFYYGLNATPFDFAVTRSVTVKNFSLRISTVQPGDGTLVANVQLIRVNTTLQITIPVNGAALTYFNTTDSFQALQGTQVVIRLTNNSPTANSGVIREMTFELET